MPKKQKAPDKSPVVTQRNKIDFDFNIRERNDLTDKQKQFIDLVLDKGAKIVFVDGPAGTSKTFLGVYCALKCLQNKSVSDIYYIRSIIESASKSLGSLPGSENEKLHPFLMPLYDKLDEIIGESTTNKLIKDERIQGIPVNYLRGASWNAKFVLLDEAQNLNFGEKTTVISRLGKYSKLVIAGDTMQSDLNGKSGFKKMFDIFDTQSARDNGIHCFTFDKNDIVRSGVLKFILEEIEKYNLSLEISKKPRNESFDHLRTEIWQPSS